MALAACGGGNGPSATPSDAGGDAQEGGAATLTSVQVTPATSSIAASTTQQFKATANFSDGTTKDVSATATWASSDATVATVSSSGLASGVKAGTATITAKVTTGAGSPQSGTAKLTVTAATLTKIDVTPANPNVVVGLTQQFTATGTFSDNTTQDVSTTASWASSDTTKATVDTKGLATAVAAGTTNISAKVGSVSGQTTMTVTTPTVVSITVSPNPGTTTIGGAPVQFKATAIMSDNSNVDVTTSAAWTSSAASVATVGGATGLATPVAAGTASISAAFQGKTGTAALVVSGATLSSISVTPAAPSIAVGNTVTFDAKGTYSDGSTLDLTSAASWQSGTIAVATVTANVATGVSAGTSTITATFGGVSGTATLTVTSAVLTGITIAPASLQTIPNGGTITFVATGTYSDGNTADISSSVTWNSSTAGILSFTGPVAKGTAVGNTSVTATQAGLTSNATPVVVTAATLASIAIAPNPAGTIHIGQTLPFTATGTYSDGTTQDITTTAVWTSSTPATATITTGGAGAGVATGVAAGTTNITAASGSATSPAVVLTVSSATLVTITIAPASKTVATGQTQQFTATGTYSDNSTANITSTVSWTATNNSGALTADFTVTAGLVTGVTSTVSDAAMTAGNGFPAGQGLVNAKQGAITGVAQVRVTSSTVTGITVACTSSNLFQPNNTNCIPSGQGLQVSCTATATYSDGTSGDITGTASWTSTTATVATFGGLTNGQALFSVIGDGNTTAAATLGGVTGNSTTITGAAETLDPTGNICQFFGGGPGGAFAVFDSLSGGHCGTSSLNLGLTDQFHAAAAYNGACSGPTDEYFDVTSLASWSSTNAGVATISNAAATDGLATAVSVGTTTIAADWQSQTGNFTLQVVNSCLQSLAIDQTNPTYPVDVFTPLTVKAVFSNSATPVQLTPGDVNYTWSNAVVNATSWMLDTSQTITNPVTIKSAFNGCSNAPVTATTTVTIDGTTLPSGLSIAPASSTIGYLSTVDYTATASYPTYGSFNVSQQSVCTAASCWTTTPASPFAFTADAAPSLNETLTTGSTGAGTYAVAFVYRNQTATSALTVNATHSPTAIAISAANVGAPTSIALPGAGAPVGLPVALTVTVTYSDGTSDNSLAGVSFTPAAGGVVGAFTGNVTTTLAAGTAKVTASVAGSCAGGTCTSPSFSILVNGNTITGMGFSPTPLNMAESTNQPLSITGQYTGGQAFDIGALVTSSSADTTIASVTTSATGTTVASTAKAGSTTLSFTKDSLTVQDTVTVTGKCVTNLSISPSSAQSLALGSTDTFTASATYSDGTNATVTGTATWLPASGGVLTNNGSGSFTGAATGSATVEATMTGAGVCAGGNASNTTVTSNGVAVTVGAATVASIQSVRVHLDNGANENPSFAPVGGQRQLLVTALMTDGTTTDQTANCSFSSANPAVVSVSSTGLVTAQAVGTTTITATYGTTSINGTVTISGENCGLPALTGTAAKNTVAVGSTLNFKATALFAASGTCTATANERNFTNLTSLVAWTSSAPAVATIGNTGVLTGVFAGNTNVTAAWAGATSTAFAVTVDACTLTKLTVSAGSPLPTGDTEVVSVTPTWAPAACAGLPAPAVSWNVVDPTVLTVGTVNGTANTLTGVKAGTTAIEAQSGLIVSNQLSVTISTACLTSITLSTPATTLPVGVPFAVSAACVFSDGTTPPCNPAFGATGSIDNVTLPSSKGQFLAGTGTVTANVPPVGSCPAIAATPLAITGGTATLASIALAPTSSSIAVQTTQQYTSQGVYSGGTGAGSYDITAVAPLTSSDTTVATDGSAPDDMTQAATVLGLATGSSIITSSYEGVTSNVANLTVNTTKVLLSITITADQNLVGGPATSAEYPAGGYNLQLHATGNYNDNSTADLTSTATWSLSGTLVAGASIGSTGLLTTGTTAGPQTVQASSGSVSNTFNVGFDTGASNSVAIVSNTDGPPATTVANGASVPYAAVATIGANSYWVTNNFTWSSTAPTVGTIVGSGNGAGTYKAVAASGSTSISATRGPLTAGPVTITDSAATPSSVTCAPLTVSVAEGSNAQLTATVLFSDGSSLDETTSAFTTWTDSNPAAGSVSTGVNGGLFTATGNGSGQSTNIVPTYNDGVNPAVTAGAACVITVQ